MKYNPDIHRRKSIRLKKHDYSKNGLYYITICVHDRECILCDHVGAGFPRPNKYGKIVETYWNNIPEHFENIKIGEFIIMPNHIHGIIIIENNEIQEQGGKTPPLRQPTLGQIVGYFKYQTTKYINQIDGTIGKKIWQRNYYEHVIRTENDLKQITEYIKNNPINWDKDNENPTNTVIMKNSCGVYSMSSMTEKFNANEFNELKKGIKEISSILLESFRTRLITGEDISQLQQRIQIRFV